VLDKTLSKPSGLKVTSVSLIKGKNNPNDKGVNGKLRDTEQVA
jgi:hypothetical protein